jgi:dUTP pyrophosphatase
MEDNIMFFRKVSYEQFVKDYTNIFYPNEQLPLGLDEYLHRIYDNIQIPKRGTKFSAGYDLTTPIAFKLEPGDTILIPSGIRVCLDDDKVFQIYPRSSTGMKGLYIQNQVGVIDSDYFFAKNEGHIMYGLGNRSNETILYSEGARILQGIINKYYTVEEDNVYTERTGGTGSTGK